MLLLSLLTLFAGPLLFQWISSAHPLARTLERGVVAVLIVLVVLLLIPDIVEPLGWVAPLLVLLGYLLPGVLERMVKRAAETMHLLTLYVALGGLLVHALLDGAGLAGSELQAGETLAVAIVLHRFGMGLVLWLIIQPAFGGRAAWLTLVALAVATVIGFEFSERLLPLAGGSVVDVIEALIVGTIIHSLVYRGHVHSGHAHGTGDQGRE
ncbi:MAG: hypothetical protein PVJ33_09220 [Lysobacterales bacterium]